MIPYIILVTSFILDGILSNFLPFMEGDLSFFTPLVTIVALFLIYTFFDKENNKYYLTAFITGLLYDLFYTNLFFLNAFLFVLIAFITVYIYGNERIDFFRVLIYLIFIIALYESSIAILIVIFNVVPMSIDKLLYKISHTLILNLIYGEVIYFIIQIIPKKYKKKRLN